MMAWLIINFAWSAILLIASARFYLVTRAFERDQQKISRLHEEQQRKQRQL